MIARHICPCIYISIFYTGSSKFRVTKMVGIISVFSVFVLSRICIPVHPSTLNNTSITPTPSKSCQNFKTFPTIFKF